MIWFNHTCGQICLLNRTVLSDDRRGPWATNLKIIQMLMQFVDFFLFQIPSSTSYLQSIN